MGFEAIITALSSSGKEGASIVFFAILAYGAVQILNIGVGHLKKSLDKKEKIKGIVKRDEADRVIQGLLDGAMATLKGERIQVIEFTNSNKNIALVPFNFMTCTYESYQIGKQSMADVCKNVPVTLMGMFLQRLGHVSYIVLNSESVNKDFPAATYDMLNKRMATKAIYIPIKSPQSRKMIGYLLLDSNDMADFTDVAFRQLTSVADQIGVLLTLGEW